MANRYWVGGTATWDGTAGSKWSTTSGGAGGAAVPTAADDVFFSASSTGTITTSGTTTDVCRSLDCTGFTGTLNHAASTRIGIGDGTAGASNIALKLVAGMTYTLGAATTSEFYFNSTSATQQTIDSGGKTIGIVVFNSAGNWLLSAGMTTNTSSSVTLGAGTLNTNSQACTWGRFVSSNSNTRVLTLGSSTITLQNGTATTNIWDLTTVTGFTLNAGTSSIVCRSNASAPTFVGGSLTYNNVSVTQSSGGFTLTGSNTFNNFTMDCTVIGSGNRPMTISGAVTQTVGGTFTYIGNNNNSSRGTISSGTIGTATTIALGASGAATLTNVDLRDIAVTGTAAPVSGTALGDGGGNSGITFDAPRTLYWVGNAGNLSDTTHWSLTSGGAGSVPIPLLHDTARFDANSFSSGSQTVTNNMIRFCGLDFTGVTNTPTFTMANPSGSGNAIYGTLTLVSGMVYASSATITVSFFGRGSYTITHAGHNVPVVNYTFNGPGSTYTLADDMIMDASRTLAFSSGTFTANGFNVTAGLISSSNSAVRTINMGSGTWTASGVGTVWQFSTMTNITFNSDTSTLVISDTSASTKTFAHGSGITMYNLSITTGGAGAIIFGANSTSWNDVTVTGGSTKTLSFTAGAGSAHTIRNAWNISGAAGNLITLQSGTPGSPFFLSKSSGAVTSDYLSIQDSTAQGGASWYAGANSTNVSGNTGWVFTGLSLTTNDITNSLSIDNASINQNHVVGAQDVGISLSEDATSIDQIYFFSGADLSLGLSTDNTSIAQNHVVSSSDIAVALLEDSDTITQNHVLPANDLSLALTLETTSIVYSFVLATQDIGVGLSEDNAGIVQSYVFSGDDIALSLSEDNTSLSQNHIIVTIDSLLSLTADNTRMLIEFPQAAAPSSGIYSQPQAPASEVFAQSSNATGQYELIE